jgi:hypothetical protein
MTKRRLTVVTLACAGVAAGGFALSPHFGSQTGTLATDQGSAVVFALAPPQISPAPTPAVDSAPALPETPPLPERVPRVPPIDLASTAKDDAKPATLGEAAAIQVAARPSPVRAGPSETAPMLYGFPAGRQLRVINCDGDFAQVKDVESGAQGWIKESALATSMLTASISPQAAPKSKPAKSTWQASAEIDTPDPVEPIPQTRERGGVLGGGRGGGGLAGLVQRAFGGR